ncbi:hypothetical protein TROLL_195 [Bacillus phage Troll]|uniref:DUF7336 domain-containing protein n=6 Tax=Caudoviricetes TaxID=2731619 RepID=A0A075LYU0_9CAUD|nr:hypothetical protein TROLL_195 [Bacillus phage Troll]YP_009055952.1 hypothetical protein LD11_gp187 [Bacillus phage Riley]YP_009206547.1 hypothetical protein AVV02_gp192 [Bacillus phage AvesoBmore]YP_009290065.1 transposase [Bacillus phage Phrodo]AMW61717.1 transposase [Bacillus phage Juglone]ASZ75920.1 hypothetical protein TAFFO16_187 [Bacillus phage Taffo16]QDH49885.1 hypothetical protein BEYONPHE_198 [Bacillus phage Beyonphe]UGO48998.1 hypothetical protein JARJAR_184 [Bacillus phage vB
MNMYILYVSYPYEGGYVYGVFSTLGEAEKARNNEEFDYARKYMRIQPITLDKPTQIII